MTILDKIADFELSLAERFGNEPPTQRARTRLVGVEWTTIVSVLLSILLGPSK